RVLLHPVRRHVPGSQRPAVRGPYAEVSARRDHVGDPRAASVADRGPPTRSGRPDQDARVMFKRAFTKPDGRPLILYGRQPFADPAAIPSPSPGPFAPNAHLRWHPLRGEWVAYATHRQHRTFLPPPDYNPLAPTVDPAHPTELPDG